MYLLRPLLLVLAATVPLTAQGQSYPSKSIRIIISASPFQGHRRGSDRGDRRAD